MEDITEIGKIVKPDGIKGFVLLDVNQLYEKSVEKADFLFIFIDGLPVPFRIEKIKSDRGLGLKLEEVDSPEDAALFTGLSVGLHKKDLLQIKKGLVNEKDDLKNFVLFDQNTEVGMIEEIVLYPGQLMALVKNKSGAIIHIPMIEDWIISIDEKNKIICMNLPEGLLEVIG